MSLASRIAMGQTMKNFQSSGGLKDLSKCGDRSGIACNGMRSNNIRGILRYRRGAETVATKPCRDPELTSFQGFLVGTVEFSFSGVYRVICRSAEKNRIRIHA